MNDNYITKEEKIDFIKNFSKQYDISPYEIAEKTSISAMGVYNIINDKSKNPREKTLDIIIQYFEKKITGSKFFRVQEPEEKYNKKDKSDLIGKMNDIEFLLKENFNILAKGISETINNTRDIKKDTGFIYDDVKTLRDLLSK
jgi:transcriptional regulator with XRE-family HTH domain